MSEEFSRTELLIGSRGVTRLHSATVAVFGVGGVGSYVVEALARSGVGKLVLCDADTVSVSNINRQLVALHSTVGRKKVEVAAERVRDIYPEIALELHPTFFSEENQNEFQFSEYDYVVDAIDTVSAKILLVQICTEMKIPILSCMGAGNKLDPTKFVVTDIYKTTMCPLAKVMRHELRARGIPSLKVVYSTEPPIRPVARVDDGIKRAVPGSISFVPSAAGLIAAGEVIKDLVYRTEITESEDVTYE